MYDGGKILGGLVVFAALAGFPFWYSFAETPADRDGDGTPDYKAVPRLPPSDSGCIEATEYMRAHHMELLHQWRDDVVRGQNRTYHAMKDGQTWDKSLSRTCMSCHTDQQAFCGECHDFMGVAPTCWGCHVQPELDQRSSSPAPPPPTPAPASHQGGK